MARSFSANLAANLYAQLSLLSDPPSGPNGAGSFHNASLAAQKHSLITTPIFTAAAGLFVDKNYPAALNQYGLLGRALELVKKESRSNGGTDGDGVFVRKPERDSDPRVFLNGNAPWSAFICGLQGSGKSHTLACMLENMLLQSPALGALPNPLTAIVFHFDINNSANALRPCEAAYLATHMPVRVLVSASNFPQMSHLYGGIASTSLAVRPLKLRQSDLNIERMLSLMSVDKNSDHPPLYMEYVRKILRELATASSIYGSGFDYKLFKEMIMNADLTPMQKGPLTLRLEILESFLEMDESMEEVWDFSPGVITIVDLSDPFVDEASACALFDICVGLFLEKDVKYGRVIALDEAHKYMTDTSPAQKLTDNLLSVIRQQRHLATRVLISTQEPTISPKLLDLCNVIIAHRFTSPEWLSFMKRHLAAIAVEAESNALLARIVGLNEGEAYLFAPAGIISNRDFEQIYTREDPDGEGGSDEDEDEDVSKLGLGYLKIKVRKRLTEDGGKSILANSVAIPVAARAAGVIPADIAAAMVNKKGDRQDRGGRGRGGGPPGRLAPQSNTSTQPRRYPPQPPPPQQNGGGAGLNNWDYVSQAQQNNHYQQPNGSGNQGSWDPNQGVNFTSAPTPAPTPTPKKDSVLKAMEKAARKQALADKAAKVQAAARSRPNGANGSGSGSGNGGASLPKKPQQQYQQQDDPNAGWG